MPINLWPSPCSPLLRLLSNNISAYECRRCRRQEFSHWVRKIPWRGKWQPTPVFLPGKFHGQRSLVGYSPWGHRVGHKWVIEHTHIHLIMIQLVDSLIIYKNCDMSDDPHFCFGSFFFPLYLTIGENLSLGMKRQSMSSLAYGWSKFWLVRRKLNQVVEGRCERECSVIV